MKLLTDRNELSDSGFMQSSHSGFPLQTSHLKMWSAGFNQDHTFDIGVTGNIKPIGWGWGNASFMHVQNCCPKLTFLQFNFTRSYLNKTRNKEKVAWQIAKTSCALKAVLFRSCLQSIGCNVSSSHFVTRLPRLLVVYCGASLPKFHQLQNSHVNHSSSNMSG